MEKGDIVRLKSGGPKMTVRNGFMIDHGQVGNVICTWFDHFNRLQQEVFEKDELEPVSDAE